MGSVYPASGCYWQRDVIYKEENKYCTMYSDSAISGSARCNEPGRVRHVYRTVDFRPVMSKVSDLARQQTEAAKDSRAGAAAG